MGDDRVMAGYERTRFSLWRWLGFGRCRARWEDDEAPDYAEGYLAADVFTHLDWKDRLRVLVSGNMMTSVAIKTDCLVKRSLPKSKVSVLPPGDIRRQA